MKAGYAVAIILVVIKILEATSVKSSLIDTAVQEIKDYNKEQIDDLSKNCENFSYRIGKAVHPAI